MIQKKDNEILSLSDKHQPGDELDSIMKQRVSKIQEERIFGQTKFGAWDIIYRKFNERAW